MTQPNQRRKLNLIFCLFFLPLFLPFLSELVQLPTISLSFHFSFLVIFISQVLALYLRLKWQLKHPLCLSPVTSFIFKLLFVLLVTGDVLALFDSSLKLMTIGVLMLLFILNVIIGFIQIQSSATSFHEDFPDYHIHSKTVVLWLGNGVFILLLLFVDIQALGIIPKFLPYYFSNFAAFGLVIFHWWFNQNFKDHNPIYNHIYTTLFHKSGVTLLVLSVLFKDLHWPLAGIGLMTATVLLVIGFILSVSPIRVKENEAILDNDL